MLLNKSYFLGQLAIAQLGQKAVDDNLNVFINRFEPEILQAALGYDLYEAFMTGIDVGSDESIDQKWLDLMNGCVYTTSSGIKRKWVGFAGNSNTKTLVSSVPEPLFITAGETEGFPVGANYYNNTALAKWNFALEFRGIGLLKPATEWNPKTTGGIELVDANHKTQAGEIWIIHYLDKKVSTTAGSSVSNTRSPLAAMIYVELMRDTELQKTASGLVKSQSENSVPGNPAHQLSEVWNQAIRDINVLWDFLYMNSSTYTQYESTQVDLCYFKPINAFGI